MLAKVVQPDQLKASLKIAETQARDIQIGQPAEIDTHNGVIDGKVMRIDPAVLNGTVTVDVELVGALPQGARPDLSVDGTIDLDRLTNVLYVGRPAFGNENSTDQPVQAEPGWQDGSAGSGEGGPRLGEQHPGAGGIAGGRYGHSFGHEPLGQHGPDSAGVNDRLGKRRNRGRRWHEAGQALIQIEDLTKVFYTDEIETHALSGVHLKIKRGRLCGDVRAFGLRQIDAALDHRAARHADGGRYKLNGKAVANLNFADRSRIRNQEIGFIFQSFNLIGDLTVAENVELPLTYRAGMPAAERKRRCRSRWSAWAWRTACGTIRRSSRAVSSSVSPWPARWRVRRRSCWPTSRLETWTRRMAKR